MLNLGKHGKIGHKEREIREFCLQTVRFSKFLENARALLDLFADGREKVLGEYIFDRHYVVSLIDSVVDRLGMMVYDASVLAPGETAPLFAAYDRQKQAARGLLCANAPAGTAGPPAETTAHADDPQDPEYRLLSSALAWFHGTAPPGDTTVLDFMKQAFQAVIQGMESVGAVKTHLLFHDGRFRTADTGMHVVDVWKDPLALPAERRRVSEVNSVPLRHLLLGVGRETAGDIPSPAAVREEADWVAAVSESRLSLHTLKPGVCFRLEALTSGVEPSDFIFVYTDRGSLLDRVLPAGFHVEHTAQGRLAWGLDLSAKVLEESLMTIGRNLFDENLWRVP